MIWGFVHVEGGAIVTHKKTFVLSSLDYFEVEQPFIKPAVIMGCAFAGYTAAFSDLLYPVEIASILAACSLSFVAGWHLAQLRLHGSSLRGTTYGQAVWGRYESLQEKRAEIVQELGSSPQRGEA